MNSIKKKDDKKLFEEQRLVPSAKSMSIKGCGVDTSVFSPNGDGIHDKWVIQYLESYPGCTVDIYNRYGQRLYHSEGYTNPWDGTINGKPVPVGTYYYIVNPKNGRSIMSGYVDIIR